MTGESRHSGEPPPDPETGMLPDARPSRRTECPGPDRRVGTLPATGSPADADRRPRTVRSVGPSTPARNARRPAVPAVDPGATVGPDGVLRPSSVRPGRWTADRCGAGTHRSGADASAVGEGDDLRPTRAVARCAVDDDRDVEVVPTVVPCRSAGTRVPDQAVHARGPAAGQLDPGRGSLRSDRPLLTVRRTAVGARCRGGPHVTGTGDDVRPGLGAVSCHSRPPG
jgi:hypothetical protein